MRPLLTLRGLSLAALVLAGTPARAANCEVVPQTVSEIRNALAAGVQLRTALDETGAQVAVVARIGTDQRKRGILYTHAGLAWRDHPAGRWHFVHMLNHCGSNRSELFDDGPVDFFLERPFRYDAKVIVPTPALQEELARLLREHVGRVIHDPDYSAIAHPFKLRFQNSNQWLLELVALATDPSVERTRAEAQKILRAMEFEPERVKLGFFERVGTHRMGNVSLADHSRREQRRGGFQYVSVRSVERFFIGRGLAQSVFEIACEACRASGTSAVAP